MVPYESKSHRTLREQVYDTMKKQILTGEIQPGARLMEIDLSEKLGVSRTPIREAIRKLEEEGLVILESRKGARVSPVTAQDMEDVLLVREDLEGLAAALAAQAITEQDIGYLEVMLEEYEQAIRSENMDQIIALDADFHKRIVSLSRNKLLMSFSASAQDQALRFRYLYYVDQDTRAEHMPEEHREIIQALASRDSQRARQVAEEHIRRLRNDVSRMIR